MPPLGPIPGLAGEDYPIYSFPPPTSFQCSGLVNGYYADPEAECQSFHICGEGGRLLTTRLCPNGTLYNQQYFICDWWFNVDCSVVGCMLITGYKYVFILILRLTSSTLSMKRTSKQLKVLILVEEDLDKDHNTVQ